GGGGPRRGGEGHPVNAPAPGDCGPQHFRLEHEPAALQLDLVEELDRIDAEARLRVVELEAACPVHEEARDPDRIEPIGRQRLAPVEPPSHHDRAAPSARRVQQELEVGRTVLSITVERHHGRGATLARRRDTRADRRALAEPARAADHLGARAPRERRAVVARTVVDHQDRAVRARSRHHVPDGLGLVEDRDDDQRGHAARASDPATTIAIWLPPRATAWTSASPSPASAAAVATDRAASPEWRPAGRLSDRCGGRCGASAPSTSARSPASRGPSPPAAAQTRPPPPP